MKVNITEIQAPAYEADGEEFVFVNHDEHLNVIVWEPELGTTSRTHRQEGEGRQQFIERAAEMAWDDCPATMVLLRGYEHWGVPVSAGN